MVDSPLNKIRLLMTQHKPFYSKITNSFYTGITLSLAYTMNIYFRIFFSSSHMSHSQRTKTLDNGFTIKYINHTLKKVINKNAIGNFYSRHKFTLIQTVYLTARFIEQKKHQRDRPTRCQQISITEGETKRKRYLDTIAPDKGIIVFNVVSYCVHLKIIVITVCYQNINRKFIWGTTNVLGFCI